MKLYFLCLFALLAYNSFSQDLILETRNNVTIDYPDQPNNILSGFIEDNRYKSEFLEVDLFNLRKEQNRPEFYNIVSDAVFLTLDKTALESFRVFGSQNIQFSIPITNQKSIVLELVEVDIKSESYKLSTKTSESVESVKSYFYRGIVKGNPNSLVALSIFENEVRLLVADDGGNYVLGALDDDSSYILYNDKNLLATNNFQCGQNSLKLPKVTTKDTFTPSNRSLSTADLKVHLEVDNQTYLDNNSNVSDTENYVTGLFNEVAVLYANESITVSISEVFVWTTTDPYVNLNTTGEILELFGQTIQNNFEGNLAHFITTRSIGGGIAWLNVLCSSYFSFMADFDNDGVDELHHAGPYAVSGIYTTYQTVPTYSWSVEVFAHEMGHNLGSNHTHACVWGANNDQPIDCCGPNSGNPEPSCGGNCNVSNPASGTIMSYCHLISGVGIDFNLGFGIEPGNLIRANTEACLCGDPNLFCQQLGSISVSTNQISVVDFGIKNKGADATSSSVLGYYLSTNNNITTSDYLISTDGVAALASGEYGLESENIFSVAISNMPPDGTYYLGMIIDYQDDISESNESDNNDCSFTTPQIIIGCTVQGAHNYSPNANFDNNNCENCSDGIQNGDETGIDCGGSLCPSCCPFNLTVNDIPIPDGTYIADNTLESQGEVDPNSNVTFKAGTNVLLLDGFKASSYFKATIEGCPQ